MEDKENKSENKTKQEITIPFLWEERPGAPKESWKTKRKPLIPVPQPVKYVASVPFKWEEKPGTPLKCFVQERKEHNKSLPLPPAYFNKYGTESDGESSYVDEFDDISDVEFEALSVQSEESFRLAPSLLQTNHPTSSKVASYSPENETSPSCENRSSSLRGDSFLQYLFPLYPPKTGFLDKPENFKGNNGVPYSNERRLPTLEEYRKIKEEFRHNGVIRRPVTLGELIMQSRRRSYRRKVVQMKNNNPPKDLDEEKPQGCFNLGTADGGLAKLLGKDLLRLKLS